MSEVIIHGFPLSTYVRTARMACIEKGLDYELDPVPPGESKARGLHPFGKIPALTHGELRLFETAAIARYIDEGFDGPPLQPADPAARALMTQWISAINATVYGTMIHGCVIPYIFPKGPDGQPDRAVIDPALVEAGEQLAVLDAAYEARDFLVGDALTLADLFLAPIVFYLLRIPEGPGLLEAAPNLRRGFAAIEARPSFAETTPPPPPN